LPGNFSEPRTHGTKSGLRELNGQGTNLFQ